MPSVNRTQPQAIITLSSPIRAGIIAALPMEGRCLTKQYLPPQGDAQLPESLYLQLSGIGPDHAYRAAEMLLSAGAKALVSWGVAGGLAPQLAPGTLLLPKQVQKINGETYYPDSQWRQRIINYLNYKLPFSGDTLCHTETVIASVAEKERLYHQTQCVAVDMESAAVAKAATDAKVPFIIIRAIADPAGISLPITALKALNTEGQLQRLSLLISLLKNPKDIIALWQLAKHSRAACTSLRTVVTHVGPALLAP
ncbi:hopanoid-associated phosphorylase [Candidatus Nitrosoglobus terrae]|uniref:Hopanoid-associated phosphorylase n=1 Tax=Candidatus Nitrosoglobus terrae TaxID=1630141 RepID=A0A1Q2SNJ2_9GAMM|nr:purine phosphorylase [Candidatus Nitrosoglobus terrae]BAW80669.1 hopanoid-associated phosphorylase [Candidatus Nitrosoglobus terrae]